MSFSVGDGITSSDASWNFGGETPHSFQVHVQRSIPFYEAGHVLICQLSDFFVKSDSVCYELGTSLGDLSAKLAGHHQIAKPDVRWIALDSEPDMIRHARCTYGHLPIEFVVEDICEVEYQKSDFIVAYYTLQFVHPRYRQLLINRLYESLHWGGALLMFEKVRGPDARFQDILSTLYTDFKLNNHYSAEEIFAKTKSLKGVLEPFSTQGNLDLLTRAGFKDMMTVMKYLCFEGFLAIK